MATYTGTPGGTGNDYADLFSVSGSSGRPASGNIYVWDGGPGSDTFSMSMNGGYLGNFSSTKFTIGTPDATGMTTVTGASNGGTAFTLHLTNVENLTFADKTVALTVAPAGPDTTPPVYQSALLNGTSLVMTYNEALGSTPPLTSEFAVAGNTVTGVAVSGTTVTLTLGTSVANGTAVNLTYTAPVVNTATTNNAIQDLAGNDAISLTTTVTSGLDTTPPTLSTAPATGVTGVPIASNIDLTFSEPIKLGTGPVQLHTGSATGTAVTVNATVSGNTLTIDPTADLAYSTHYYVTLGTAATTSAAGHDSEHGGSTTTTTAATYGVTDIAGNGFATVNAYDFTTIADPYAPHTNTVVDAGPVLVGAGGAGMLVWAFLL